MASSLEVATLGLIGAAPGVKRGAGGTAVLSGEVVIVIAQDKLGTEGQVSNVLVRGVPPAALDVRSEVHVVAGRPPRPGTDEVMIGKGLRGKYAGMDLEGSFELKKNRPVKVVGVFEAGGSSFESEVWADVDTCRSSFGRDGLVSSVTVRLDSPSKFDAFKATMESDKRLGLEALTEVDYYEKQSSGTALFIKIMGGVIVFFLSLGAMIGALITMLAAVSQRQREVGTLRALGFSRFSILTSFILESAVLALVGGVLGVLGALCMSFVKLSMMNFATWQEVTFSFDPNPSVIVGSLVFGAVMGVLGGAYPAARAASVSPVDAMRE
jgi:putative ABC transport system permease protein